MGLRSSPLPLTIIDPMSVFWRRICRWITNCFSTTNTICLHREACLPPLPCLIGHQRRLASLRLICSPPEVNPATAYIPKTMPTFCPQCAQLVALGKITNQPYLFFNLNCQLSPDMTTKPRYRHNTITALENMAAPLVWDVTTVPPISLHLMDYLPPVPP